jgi:hypothetical protein
MPTPKNGSLEREPGVSVRDADLADTSGFDRVAALGIMLSALIAFAGWWTKLSPPRREPRETQKVPPSGSCRVIPPLRRRFFRAPCRFDQW